MLDGILRNVQLGNQRIDVAWEDGVWVALGENLSLKAKKDVEASDLFLLPNSYDAHVHLNDPGRTSWENVTTGTKALARGGITLYSDMPLNSSPVTTTLKALEEKKKVTQGRSYVDYSFYGGLTPHTLSNMEELAQGGVIGFKAFTCPSGLQEFPSCDAFTLLRAMEIAKGLDLPILLHAEHGELVGALQRELREKGRIDAKAFLESRPVLTETLAVEEACAMALETGARLHLCHLSSRRSVDICKKYKLLGAKISCETMGQYLFWNEDKVLHGGALYKCTPPLRSEEERQGLLDSLMEGDIDLLASDHSPAPEQMKQSNDFFSLWGGISSLQHWLPWVMGHLLQCGLSFEKLSHLVSQGPVTIFGLEKNRSFALGTEANFTLLRKRRRTITKDELLYQVPESAFVGEGLLFDVEATYLRGEAIYQEGKFSEPKGRFVHAGSLD